MIEQKKNDWLATLFFSPNKTPQDLANLGITTDNSSLLDKEYYKKVPQIQEAFKDKSGNFDDNKFDQYYQTALKLYNDADNSKLVQDLQDFYEYDPNDYFAPIGGKVTNIRPKLVQFSNPERRSRGLSNLRESSAPTMSIREVAQTNKVFNYDTQQFEDWTPNDWGGLSAVTRPTLVLAQWDEDGEHEVNGRIVKHNKGDLKFNESGDPFYETLGNRDIANKDILHISDTLTIDGSKWDKYNFFDSDDLDKSVIGTMAKTAFKVGMMFIPGVGKYYGAMTAAKELGKLFPVLFKSIEGIATGDISTSRSAQTATDIQAWFSRFDSSVSDYGRQSFWNIENLCKLIEDSSMQLFQQRVIGNIPKMFVPKNSIPSENAIKWGRGLALAYMAGTSSTEAYNAFKEAGASDRVAGLGMLSTMGAMYGLMNNDYFKDFWFRDTYLDRAKVRSVVKEAAEQLSSKEFALETAKKTSTSKGAAKWLLDMQKNIVNHISKMKPGNLIHDSLNEGVEETVEEITSDAIKALYSGLNALGIADKERNYNFGITPEDMISRYFTSFVGGGIGGAVFSLHNRFDRKNNPILNSTLTQNDDSLKEIIYLLRDGKENQLRMELDRLHKAGKLGSTNLSGTEIEFVKDGNITEAQYKATSSGDSQNDLLYQQIGFYIDRINEVLKEEGLDLSDAELQYITQQADIAGKSIEETRQGYLNLKKLSRQQTIEDKIISSGLYSQIFEDWNNLTSEIIKTKVELENLLTPADNEPKTPKDIEARIEAMRNNSEYQRLRLKIDTLRAQRDEILTGKKNDFYTGQLLFAASPQLVDNFVSGFGIHNYTRWKYKKEYDSLQQDEKDKIDSEYKEYSSSEEKHKVLTAYNIFSEMQESMINAMKSVGEKIKDSRKVYLPGATDYNIIYDQISNRLKESRTALDKAIENLPEGISSNEEIDNLKLDISQLEDHLNQIKSLKFEVLNPALSEEGRNILYRPIRIADTNLAFNNYTDSYLGYLEYIKRNNLYLDLIDSDLASILYNWTQINNLENNDQANWINRIQSILDSQGIDLEGMDDDIANLSNELIKIVDYIKKNNVQGALEHYDYILRSDLSDTFSNIYQLDLKNILPTLLPSFGSRSFYDYLGEVLNIKSQINTNPIYELIEAASNVAELDNQEVTKLIREEQFNFINSKKVEDFIIRDKHSLDKLKETVKLIDAISAILDASVDGGFNSKINEFRESLEKELLPIISVQGQINIVSDLARVKNQLITLIDISERNQSQKLREQRDIAINMKSKFISLLTDDTSILKDRFIKIFGIDLKQLSSDIEIPSSGEDIDFSQLEQASIALETRIFEAVKNLNLSADEIADKIVSLFDSNELVKSAPTTLSKNPSTEITVYDQMVYIATILSTPSQNFYKKLKEIISSSEFKNAPIFSQEYAVRVAYSQILNKDVFNSIIIKLKDIFQDNPDTYIKTKSPLFNFTVVFGGAGVGKTKGVAFLLKKMFEDANYITSAPTRKQTDRLTNSVESDGNSFTKNELVEKILGRQIKDSDISYIKDSNNNNVSITSNINIEVLKTNLFGDSKNKILFIDEISWYDRVELELISKWANTNNVSVIAFGDYKQNAVQTVFGKEIIDSGIEDTINIKTPDLVAPLRPDNIAKYDNYISLSQRLDKIYKQYYNNPAIEPKYLSEFAEKYLQSNPVEFKYFESSFIFGGEKIIKEDEIFSHIEKLKQYSSDIAIITDNPKKYNTTKGVKIVPLNSVQGDEFDYIIIDKNFGLTNEGKSRGEFYKLKDLYTLTQRSKKGSIIVSRGLGNTISSKQDSTSSGNIEMPESQIQDFKEWRINAIPDITESIEFEEYQSQQPNNEQANAPVEPANNSVATENSTPTTSPIERDTEVEFTNPIKPEVHQVSMAPEHTEPVNNLQNTVTSDIETSKPITRPAKPVVGANEYVSTAESWIDFINNDLIKFYQTTDNNLKNIINTTPEITVQISNLVRAFFVNNRHKDNKEIFEASLKILSREIQSFIPGSLGRKYSNEILNLLKTTPKFYIIPYNNRGLLVVRLTLDSKTVDFPLLVTDPVIGEYFGDILAVSPLRKESAIDSNTSVNLSNFRQSAINPKGYFRAFNKPVVLSVNSAERTKYSGDQQEWLNQRNNGNTFMVVSSDPYVTDDDFKEFLAATTNGSIKTYSTQHDYRFALIGMNWLVSIDDIIKQSNNRKNYDIIPGYRSSVIAKYVYKVAPDRVREAIRIHLNTSKYPNQRIRINGIVYKDAELAIQNISNDSNIEFGYEINGDFKYQSGVATMNTILYKIVNRESVISINDGQIEQLKQLCLEAPEFKMGIYGRDVIDTQVNPAGDYWYAIQGHDYNTNIPMIIGNDYSIDLSAVNNEQAAEDKKVVESVNEQLQELKLNEVIVTKDNIDTAIESINSEIASKVQSTEFDVVKVEGKAITTESVFDPKVMISNQLNTPKETIHFYRDKISDFEPFFVSLQDKNYTYVLEKKNNVWNIRTFNIADAYIKFRDAMNSMSDIIVANPNLSKYITALILNQEVDKLTAESYWNEINSNTALIGLQQEVEEYLINKLKNNEC